MGQVASTWECRSSPAGYLTILQLSRERIPQTRDSRKKVPAVFPQMSTASTICQTGVAAAPRAKDGHSMPMQGKEAVAL